MIAIAIMSVHHKHSKEKTDKVFACKHLINNRLRLFIAKTID